MKPWLRGLTMRPPATGADRFPFSVPSIRSLTSLDLSAAVTFFVGENASGKSTVMEALAIAAGLPTVGSAAAGVDPTLRTQKELARAFRLRWDRQTHRGFFLRAEDFFGFARRLVRERGELRTRLEEIEVEFAGASDYAKGLAAGPVRGSLGAMTALYGQDLDANSHGESFLTLFRSRLVPQGLFLLDEPEAALSPQSQLGMITMIAEAVRSGSQFVIATHSPLLMAIPGARIFSFDHDPVQSVPYDSVGHVTLLKAFLQAPERYLRHLWSEPPAEGS